MVGSIDSLKLAGYAKNLFLTGFELYSWQAGYVKNSCKIKALVFVGSCALKSS